MSSFIEKLKSSNEAVFNTGVYHLLSKGNIQITPDKLPALLTSILTSGAIGSWIEYSDLANKNRIILGQTTVYSILIRDMLKNDNDITNSILYLIRRNIEAGLLDNQAKLEKINEDSINNLFDNMSALNGCSNKTYYDSFISIYQAVYLRGNRQNPNALAVLRNDMVIDFQVFQNCHRIIKESYFDKQDTYTKEDIDNIISALKELAIVDEVLDIIRKNLEFSIIKSQSKELRKQERERILKVTSKPSQPKKELLSKKEYNTLYRELLTYYDIDNHQAIRPLSVKEVIYCVRIMLKLSFPESTIDTFIRNIDKENKKEVNPISLYISLYDKINHYASDIDISKKVALIEDYLQQIFICSDEDYEFWKSQVSEELTELTSLLPQNSEYELAEAKKLK